ANGVATVSVAVQDDGGTDNGGVDTSPTQQFAITVTAVNDAPSANYGGDQEVLEDAGAQVVAGFASGFDAGPGEDDQSLVAYLVSNDNNALFAVQPTLATDGTLSYTPADDASGVATVSVQVQDDGGTDNGGVDTSPTQQFAITVTAVNDAPDVTLGADQSVAEDAGAQSVPAFATGFVPGGGDDEAGQAIADFLVSNDNNGLFATQPDIANDGTLSYTPADDQSGSATVSVRVQDDGGTDNGGVDESTVKTFVITVEGVNDTPTVTLAGDQQVNEDAGGQTIAGFASGFDPGQDEDGQAIADFVVSTDNPALFAVQPDIANDGALSFTPADDANGEAVVSVQVQDDGGTANGGEDTSVIQTFTLTVQAVNDAPTFVVGADQEVQFNSGARLVPGFITGFAPGGGADEASQTVDRYLVSNDNPGLFLVEPEITLGGQLSFQPAEDVSGSAVVSVRVQDDGGTDNGGVDTSAIQTFIITVNAELGPVIFKDDFEE
ncbi:MAG: Ig-like domain-containing protein, partial [Xanthomonadales bacterium]|nr:Ig-like domain-containing protein [Xanthomonadales bacterium]